MGVTLLEKEPGVWRLRSESKDEFGQRRFKYETVRGDRATAEDRKRQLLAGASMKSEIVDETFQQYHIRWIDDRMAYGFISAASAHVYHRKMIPVYGLIGDKKITALTSAMIDATYRRLVRDIGPIRTHDLSINLRKSLQDAVRAGLIDRDPAGPVPVPQGKRDPKSTTLTQAQIATLLERSKEWGVVGMICRFALATGCRRGEICALQWQDVDLLNSTVQIRRNAAMVGSEATVSKPKTKSSNRVIKLPLAMRDELAKIKHGVEPADWVFPNPEGNMRNPVRLSLSVSRKFARIGLGDFSLHDLRHAHATFLLQQKLPLKAVSSRLGHADVRITLGIYTHVMPGDDDVLANAINDIL